MPPVRQVSAAQVRRWSPMASPDRPSRRSSPPIKRSRSPEVVISNAKREEASLRLDGSGQAGLGGQPLVGDNASPEDMDDERFKAWLEERFPIHTSSGSPLLQYLIEIYHEPSVYPRHRRSYGLPGRLSANEQIRWSREGPLIDPTISLQRGVEPLYPDPQIIKRVDGSQDTEMTDRDPCGVIPAWKVPFLTRPRPDESTRDDLHAVRRRRPSLERQPPDDRSAPDASHSKRETRQRGLVANGPDHTKLGHSTNAAENVTMQRQQLTSQAREQHVTQVLIPPPQPNQPIPNRRRKARNAPKKRQTVVEDKSVQTDYTRHLRPGIGKRKHTPTDHVLIGKRGRIEVQVDGVYRL